MGEWKKWNSAETALVGNSVNLIISAEQIENYATVRTWMK